MCRRLRLGIDFEIGGRLRSRVAPARLPISHRIGGIGFGLTSDEFFLGQSKSIRRWAARGRQTERSAVANELVVAGAGA
jgi:hypothetical protein